MASRLVRDVVLVDTDVVFRDIERDQMLAEREPLERRVRRSR
jgi:hypothetical protein